MFMEKMQAERVNCKLAKLKQTHFYARFIGAINEVSVLIYFANGLVMAVKCHRASIHMPCFDVILILIVEFHFNPQLRFEPH